MCNSCQKIILPAFVFLIRGSQIRFLYDAKGEPDSLAGPCKDGLVGPTSRLMVS